MLAAEPAPSDGETDQLSLRRERNGFMENMEIPCTNWLNNINYSVMFYLSRV